MKSFFTNSKSNNGNQISQAQASIAAAKIAAITAILTCIVTFALPKLYEYWTSVEKIEYFLVANSTTKMEEAIELCDKYRNIGYLDSEVHTSSNGYFAVTLGKYEKEKANSIKKEAIIKGIIRDDSYLVSKGLNFKKYPELQVALAGVPSTSNNENLKKLVYIVILSTTNKEEAIKSAKKLQKEDIEVLVQTSDNGLYAVTSMKIEYEKAQVLLSENIINGNFRTDSYLASEGFNEVIFDSNTKNESNGEFYIFTYSTTLHSDAKRYLRVLNKRVAKKYNPQIIFTSTKNYAVILGGFDLNEAKKKKSYLIRNGKINSDSFILRTNMD